MTNKKISPIEKILINWATPVDYVTNKIPMILGWEIADKKCKFFIEENGLLRGIYKIKISDYERLIDISSKYGGIPDRVSKIFNKTPCGIGMHLTHKVFRR